MEIIDYLIKTKEFNLFLGAGISKKAPSYAPVWRELLNNFIVGLYKKLEPENWPALMKCQDHIDKLTGFDFRPETFWEFCQTYLSTEAIIRFLGVLSIGSSNTNHMLFSFLLSKGYVRNIITTNFDQYIELCCPACEVIRNDGQISQILTGNKDIRGKVVKIHGCIEEPNSLQFNLKQTEKLSLPKQDLLHKMLPGTSLLVCGYSGYDDDILPVLRQIIPLMKKIVVLSHPGSNPNEPIKKLAGRFNNVSVHEVDISKTIEAWIVNRQSKPRKRFFWKLSGGYKEQSNDKIIRKWMADNQFKFTGDVVTEQELVKKYEEITRDSFQDIVFPKIPYFLSILYNFSGFPVHAGSYARLAEDAMEDRRYAASVSKELEYLINLNLQNTSGKFGNGTGFPTRYYHSKLMESEEVKNSWEKTIEVNFERAFNVIINKQYSDALEMKQAKKNIEGTYELFKSGMIGGSFFFRVCWAMGRLRSREKFYDEAILLYEEGLACLKGIRQLDKFTEAYFMLDVAAACYNESMKKLDDSLLIKSYEFYNISRKLAENINDYETLTKSLLGLALIELFSMEFEKSKEHIHLAEVKVMHTGNAALQERISNTKDFILDSIKNKNG